MIKQKFAKEQRILGDILKKIPLSPNHITILSILLALIAGIFIFYHLFLLGILLFLIAGFLDVIDGAIARAKGMVTQFGGFLDGVSDRFVEAIFLFSLMFYDLPVVYIDSKIWLGMLIFAGTCMPSFVRAYAEHKHVVDHETAIKMGGIFERSERIITLVIGLLVGYLISWEWFIYFVILSIILSCITIIQRIYWVWRCSSDKGSDI